jgi:aminoglycoside 3-N-acetyltransferase
LTAADLLERWRRLGLRNGMALIVHSSLSSLGHVEGGAAAVVASLRHAVGPMGTIVVPTFTRQVADPVPGEVGVPSACVRARRERVPCFHPALPSSMGRYRRRCAHSPRACAARIRKLR